VFEFLLNDLQKGLKNEGREFVSQVDRSLILAMDNDQVQYPREFVQELGKRNLLGCRFPAEWGGRGVGWSEEVVLIEEIGVLGTALACLSVLPSIVGEAIFRFGTEEQKQKYLLPTLRGEKFTAEALTEPRGGSDFFGATTTAVKDGDEWILNGQKRFIVGAEGADYFLVYARTDETLPPHKGISAFLVDRGPGVEVKHVYGLMGTRGGGAGRVLFRNARVPAQNLVGELNQASKIFYQMMIPERLTSAAGAVGLAEAALEVASRYTTKRKAFNKPIKEFQAVSFKVADSITLLDASRAMVSAAARAVDAGADPSTQRRLVSEAKKFATESAWTIINHAMQVMGGIGYTNVYPIERLLRDCRLIMIWTGTNEIMDLIIQHEYYHGLSPQRQGRDLEMDAPEAENLEEKIYE